MSIPEGYTKATPEETLVITASLNEETREIIEERDLIIVRYVDPLDGPDAAPIYEFLCPACGDRVRIAYDSQERGDLRLVDNRLTNGRMHINESESYLICGCGQFRRPDEFEWND